ncbi:hypothetical protein ACWGQ5_36890 [Streptomyces sp. NPDC055722]
MKSSSKALEVFMHLDGHHSRGINEYTRALAQAAQPDGDMKVVGRADFSGPEEAVQQG